MVISDPITGPRQELSLAVVQGEGGTEGMIGQLMLPDFPLTRRTAHLIKLRAADTQARRIIADSKFLRAPGTRYERLGMKFADDTLSVQLRGVEIPVPYETDMDYDGYLNVENIVAGRLGEMSVLTKEYLRMLALTSTSIFGAATNSSVPFTVAQKANCNFFPDVIAGTRRGKAKGEPYDTLWLSGPTFEYIRQSPNVLAYIRATVSAGQIEVTEEAILNALKPYGIKQVLIGDSYYNNGPDGTLTYQQMWPNAYLGLVRSGKVSGMDDDTVNDQNIESGSPEVDRIMGISVPTMGGIGVSTYWQNWSERGLPLPVATGSNIRAVSGLQFDGGNFVGVYWSEEVEDWIARLKLSSSPYIGNPNAGELIATQANNAYGPLT